MPLFSNRQFDLHKEEEGDADFPSSIEKILERMGDSGFGFTWPHHTKHSHCDGQ